MYKPAHNKKITLKQRGEIPRRSLYVEYHPGVDHDNSQALIFLPGGPGGDMRIFKNGQLSHFQQWYNVILMDPRGCGNSEPCDIAEYHMDVYIDDVEAIRQHLGIENWVVMGGSYGSVVAQGYAIKYGTTLSELILVNGTSSASFLQDALANLHEIATKAQIAMFEQLLDGQINTAKAMTEYYRVMWPLYTPKHPDTKPPVIDNDLPARILTGGFGPGGFLRDFDFTAELKRIQCPTLIIVGENDWINSPQIVSQTAQVIKNSQYHQIPDCGHLPFLDQPERYYAVCKKWSCRPLTL